MQYIIRTLRDYDFDVELDEFETTTPIGNRWFRNIIGTFDATAPHRLVLACHYDSKLIAG